MSRTIGWLLVTLGFILVAVSLLQSTAQGGPSLGGVLMIGPIPIVFGSSPEMAVASMLLALAMMALSFLLFRGRS
ncbi:MAG TPA: DUF131 domain-containing protein [Methanothrix sp.]|nr:DUF131 domain-containing protein [Methanothrix sp.]